MIDKKERIIKDALMFKKVEEAYIHFCNFIKMVQKKEVLNPNV